MKHTVLLTSLLILAAGALYAQSPGAATPASAAPGGVDPGPDLAREATQQLKLKYQLDAAQEEKMYVIQQRKRRNLAEIEPLKDNPALYNAKLQSIQRGTLASIQRMLNTPAQQEIFQQTKSELRKQRALKRQEMTEQGASKRAIESALLEIYLE